MFYIRSKKPVTIRVLRRLYVRKPMVRQQDAMTQYMPRVSDSTTPK